MPAQITVLTVQAPEPLGADVSELRDCHLPPFMRSLKRWPLFKQNDPGAFDPEADADFVADGEARVHRRTRQGAGSLQLAGFRITPCLNPTAGCLSNRQDRVLVRANTP